MIKPGIYNHFKDNTYVVYGTAFHSETKDKLILYYAYGDPGNSWARPESMFIERVEWPDGEWHPRFKYVKDNSLKMW